MTPETTVERIRLYAQPPIEVPTAPLVERIDCVELPLDRVRLKQHPVVFPEDASPAAHAYRMLRTQLLQKIRYHKLRVVGIASAADGEGKTVTAVNLALSLAAEPNQSVVLADFDLRRPSVATLLGLAPERGLGDWFEGRADVEDVCCRIEGMARLLVAPTLAAVAGSSEVLAGARTSELLNALEARQSDCVVLLDLPPVLLSDDFLTISPLVDGVVVVATEGYTKRDDLTRMREVLGSTRVLGTVLNRASKAERRSY